MNFSRKTAAAAASTIGFLAIVAGSASAGTNTVTFPVTATVNSNCSISAVGLSFGNYDPLVANVSTALNATTTLSVACVKGVTPTVGLNTGLNSANASGTTRAMAGSSSGTYLSYELYKDSAHTQVWGNSGTGLDTLATSTNTTPVNVTVYGQIPAAQMATLGTYNDTITATVNF